MTGGEVLPPPSSPGSVVVELGAGVGAAVVTTPAELEGTELEIRPEPGEWTGRHVAVLARVLPGGVQHAALFTGLAEGAYRVRRRPFVPGTPEIDLRVCPATVTEAAWPA